MSETQRRTARNGGRNGRPAPPPFKKINFEREFQQGGKAYENVVGEWWRSLSEDRAHALAYRRIAGFIGHLRLPTRPTIADYACGHGSMLLRLYDRFPKARFIGVDGSKRNIEEAGRRLQRLDRKALERVDFIRTKLPNFDLPRSIADLVVFIFPNIVAHEDDQPYYNRHGYRHPADSAVCRVLARMREADPEDQTDQPKPAALFDEMMTNRVVARNMRRLLKKGAFCVRVEYSNSVREGLTQLIQDRTAFEEGSLERPFGGKRAERFFEYLYGDYHRSRVIEAVYHQTRDASDREGGYMTSLLRAI